MTSDAPAHPTQPGTEPGVVVRGSTTANTAQAEYWSGERGSAWVRHADWFDAQLASYAVHLLAAADPVPGEHVVDVGCGAGVTSLGAARLVGPAGSVIGLDISPTMLGVARKRAEESGLTNVSFLCADAQTTDADLGRPTLIISRFGVMFFDDPVAAFANLAAAADDAARLLFVCWGPLTSNEWMFEPARVVAGLIAPSPAADPTAPGPFALSDGERLRAILTDAGWVDIEYVDLDEELYLGGPGSAEETVEFVTSSSTMSGPYTALDPADRATVRSLLLAEFSERFDGVGVRYPALARLVSARRV